MKFTCSVVKFNYIYCTEHRVKYNTFHGECANFPKMMLEIEFLKCDIVSLNRIACTRTRNIFGKHPLRIAILLREQETSLENILSELLFCFY